MREELIAQADEWQKMAESAQQRANRWGIPEDGVTARVYKDCGERLRALAEAMPRTVGYIVGVDPDAPRPGIGVFWGPGDEEIEAGRYIARHQDSPVGRSLSVLAIVRPADQRDDHTEREPLDPDRHYNHRDGHTRDCPSCGDPFHDHKMVCAACGRQRPSMFGEEPTLADLREARR